MLGVLSRTEGNLTAGGREQGPGGIWQLPVEAGLESCTYERRNTTIFSFRRQFYFDQLHLKEKQKPNQTHKRCCEDIVLFPRKLGSLSTGIPKGKRFGL